jgi:RNA polymerase sigma-70 factor (ECF subfamily)
MREEAKRADLGRRGFPTTDWSAVHRAGKSGADGGRDALSELLKKYSPALKAHLVRFRNMTPDEADDLLQDFLVEKVVRQKLIAHADQQRGKFRAFLLKVLGNFWRNHIRYKNAKRRAAVRTHSYDDLSNLPSVSSECDAEGIFDVEWARSVLDQAIQRMETECMETQRCDIWMIFTSRILGPTLRHEEPMPYEDIVRQLQLKAPAQAFNLLATAKRTFDRILRAVISEYARDDSEIDEEIHHLREILSHGGARGDG